MRKLELALAGAPRATHGGTRELITAIKCCRARQKCWLRRLSSSLRALPTIVAGIRRLLTGLHPATYTSTNNKSAWRGTGSGGFPSNPGAAPIQLPCYKSSQSVPKVSTSPQPFKLLKTPVNLRELRQQTPSAIGHRGCGSAVSGVAERTSVALLRRLAHQSEAALARVKTSDIETADMRRKYAGKRAPRPITYQQQELSTIWRWIG